MWTRKKNIKNVKDWCTNKKIRHESSRGLPNDWPPGIKAVSKHLNTCITVYNNYYTNA